MIPTAGVLIYKDNKVLLVKHSQDSSHLTGKYGIPAGVIRPNESAEDTAVRKLKAETGLNTNIENLEEIEKIYSAKIERKDGIKEFSLKVFICEKYSGEIITANNEFPEWINLKDINNIDLLPNMKKIIEDGLRNRT
ncbi:MAG: NUDIX hydrolase [Candidatus Woesearchaeota archaeon]